MIGKILETMGVKTKSSNDEFYALARKAAAGEDVASDADKLHALLVYIGKKREEW